MESRKTICGRRGLFYKKEKIRSREGNKGGKEKARVTKICAVYIQECHKRIMYEDCVLTMVTFYKKMHKTQRPHSS